MQHRTRVVRATSFLAQCTLLLLLTAFPHLASAAWHREIRGTGIDGGAANAIAVDSAGNVISAGQVGNAGTGLDFVVVKYDGTTGDELWRRVINGTDSDHDIARAVAVDSSGHVFAAG